MRNKYCWDSCVFLAWIKDEATPPRQPGDMEGVTGILQEIERGDAILIASSIIHTEVLVSDLNDDQRNALTLALRRPSTFIQNADLKVCQLAGEIRDYYLKEKQKNRSARLDSSGNCHSYQVACSSHI